MFPRCRLYRQINKGTIVTGIEQASEELTVLANCCASPKVKDLSQGIGDGRHFYCSNCKAHLWRGRQYTAKEWDAWINS